MIRMANIRLKSIKQALVHCSSQNMQSFSNQTNNKTKSSKTGTQNNINNKTNSSFLKQPIIDSKFRIIEKKKINHDSYIYYLGWAGPKFKFSIGQHFRIVENIPTYEHPEGEQVIRKYTPISPCSQQDLIQLLIKIYRPNTDSSYPQGGKLTPYLQKLQVGDIINIDGPFGKFGYKPRGIVVINGKQVKKNRIFFIAGGTGITPCYQTIKQILKIPNQTMNLTLLYANKTESDMLLRKQLEQLQPRLNLYYSLDVNPQNWKYFNGYVTKEMLSKVCPLDDPDTLYIHCGPRGMNILLRQIFAQYFPKSDLFKY